MGAGPPPPLPATTQRGGQRRLLRERLDERDQQAGRGAVELDGQIKPVEPPEVGVDRPAVPVDQLAEAERSPNWDASP